MDTTVAARILQQLHAEGVDVVFGVPGVHNLPFWRPTGPDTPRIITVRHEQAAGHAADGYSRATGQLGVALTTSGPGTSNVVTAFGEAHSCASPVLFIASEPPLHGRRTSGHDSGQLHAMADQAGLFGDPFDGFALTLRSPLEASHLIPSVASVLLRLPAPGYVGIPADTLAAPADQHAPHLPDLWDRRPDLAPAIAEPGDIERLADVLRGARVVLWIGAETLDCADLIDEVASRLGAPIIATLLARGATHGELGVPPHEPEVAALIESADVLLVLGDPLHAMPTQSWTMRLPPHVVVVTKYTARSLGDYDLSMRLETDVATTLTSLLPLLDHRPPWATQYLAGTVRDRLSADARTAEALDFVQAVEQGWPTDCTIVTDMCIAGYWLANYAALRRARQLQHPLGWGTLGYGLPAAMGPAAAGKPTLAVVGDGGAAMGLGELATYVQEQLPIALLVVDDGGYGMLRYDQDVLGVAHRGVDLVGPHWPTIAKAYGMRCQEITGVDALARALRAERHSVIADGPVLLHLRASLFPPRTSSPRWREV